MNGTFKDAPRLRDIIECTCDGSASVTALRLFRTQDDSPRSKILVDPLCSKADEGHWADNASLNLSSEAEHRNIRNRLLT